MSEELVKITIDGEEYEVPQGLNIIEAARSVGIEIPHYCYHPHLSVPGNCRMCQVEIKGAPRLAIGCHTRVNEGMEVLTHHTSEAVRDAQAATLEFILINHPLDCTVCDQAGHCKLQDYHFQYNARPSRFLEQKVNKIKAEPLGPTVMLDGERCIMCTRCIRFCDEVTKTSELGMLNRGDRSVIAVNPGKVLDNPLSGTVVDLCPVGALTHRSSRFRSRIWFTNQVDSICPGCSTGCNVRVAVRDREVVEVKARLNSDVNQEWLCDEGRYGFERFLPKARLTRPLIDHTPVTWDEAYSELGFLKDSKVLFVLSPRLFVEDYFLARKLIDFCSGDKRVVLAYRGRELSETEAILVSPDYAANFRGAQLMGLVQGALEEGFRAAQQELEAGSFESLFVIGDLTGLDLAEDNLLRRSLGAVKQSGGILADPESPLAANLHVQLPGRSNLERSGLVINRAGRIQYSERLMEFPEGTQPVWRILNELMSSWGQTVAEVTADRDMTIGLLNREERFQGLTIRDIKAGGVQLESSNWPEGQ